MSAFETPLGGKATTLLRAAGLGARHLGYCRVYQPGTYTFTAPYTGQWKFVLHGAGGDWTNLGTGQASASGAYVEKTIPLNAGQTVGITVGAGGSGTNTTAVAAGYPTMSAGAANSFTVGVASGGDVNLDGSLGGTSGAVAGVNGLGAGGGSGGTAGGGWGGGGGAPGSAEFPGGKGQDGGNTATTGISPGGGRAGTAGGPGGDGRAVVLLVSY
jgi:hypothetical protein